MAEQTNPTAAERELAQMKADEKTIAAKMASGLTREQAVRAIKNQRAFDAKKKGGK